MLFCLLFLIFLPNVILGQDPQCQEEFNKMLGCITNVTLFSRIDDMNLFDEAKSRALSSEIGTVLNCADQVTCNASIIFKKYMFQQKWIIDFYHDTLSNCLTIDTYRNLAENCRRIPRPPSNGEEDFDPCIKAKEPCLARELVEQPNCGAADGENFSKLQLAWYNSCTIEFQHAPEIRMYIDGARGHIAKNNTF